MWWNSSFVCVCVECWWYNPEYTYTVLCCHVQPFATYTCFIIIQCNNSSSTWCAHDPKIHLAMVLQNAISPCIESQKQQKRKNPKSKPQCKKHAWELNFLVAWQFAGAERHSKRLPRAMCAQKTTSPNHIAYVLSLLGTILFYILFSNITYTHEKNNNNHIMNKRHRCGVCVYCVREGSKSWIITDNQKSTDSHTSQTSKVKRNFESTHFFDSIFFFSFTCIS